MNRPRRRAHSTKQLVVAVLTALACTASFGCQKPSRAPRPSLLVVGIDGADPAVVRGLVGEGELPNFARLAAAGTLTELASAYGSASPVVWTTMVTGVGPDEHGISDFLAPTANGSAPISSAGRRRPALWDMLTRVGRAGAFLGLWATWPAERSRGLILSDRFGLGLDDDISPPAARPRLRRWLRHARGAALPYPETDRVAFRDVVVRAAAEELLTEGQFDLVFPYFRMVDVTSHHFWHIWEPSAFANVDADELTRTPGVDPVRYAYRWIDETVGALVQAAGPGTNVLIVSDHGFHAHREPGKQIVLDFDQILLQNGLESRRTDGAVDESTSFAWTISSPVYSHRKLVHVRRDIQGEKRRSLVSRLDHLIRSCRFRGGGAAFDIRPPSADDRASGADLQAVIRRRDAASAIACDGRKIEGAVSYFGGEVTGTHTVSDAGVLLASGPIFAPAAEPPAGLSVCDVAPTILYALGLPVAKDFCGQPAVALFTERFRRQAPVREIASWGRLDDRVVMSSAADQKLIEELVALGYLN